MAQYILSELCHDYSAKLLGLEVCLLVIRRCGEALELESSANNNKEIAYKLTTVDCM